MANTHGVADMAKELQATTSDLLPACIVTTSWPTVPVPPSLTLAAFATAGYVRDGVDLVYCAQEAHTVTLTGGDGTYWLGLGQDTFTTVAAWNRTAGTQYLWRPSATRPPDVDGLLVFSQITVSGGNITAVAPAAGVTRAEALRALAGLGTMATQNANAVAITGGTATLSTLVATETATLQKGVNALNAGGSNVYGFVSNVAAAGGSNRFAFYGTSDAPSLFGGTVQVVGGLGAQAAPVANAALNLRWAKAGQDGIKFTPSDSDSGFAALQFLNTGGTPVGSITTTASATAYNTSSDARLKTAVQPLTGAGDVVRRLRPVTHLWRADGSRGYGFLAHEVQQEIPDGGVVTGEPDAVDVDGQIVPQQMDPSKLVPWLTAALQEALAALDTLTARVQALEAARG